MDWSGHLGNNKDVFPNFSEFQSHIFHIRCLADE